MPVPPKVQTVAIVGNHLPRHCGIATFTSDLAQALQRVDPAIESWVVAMNDRPEGYSYGPEVRYEIQQDSLEQYRQAADFVTQSGADIVCLQHEYGIFGGQAGHYVMELLNQIQLPLVTTLHTVLQEPDESQRAVMDALAHRSDRLVVMSQMARKLLTEVYAVPTAKIVLIEHGIPDVPFMDPNYFKEQLDVEGRTVILTFGLLSPGKGIETMIEALPRVVEAFPDVIYLVLGATHPHVLAKHGDVYRESLQALAARLGVEQHVRFINRFVPLAELCEFLGAAELYVTPYLGTAQIASGTLAYALGAGNAVISTPYWYAEELLADGRGILTPFRDAPAMAANVLSLLADRSAMHALRKKAYTYTRGMVWSQVAARYHQLFSDVKTERALQPTQRARRHVPEVGSVLPELGLDHLRVLTDQAGILQHARHGVPQRAHGYCTDDNARALLLWLRLPAARQGALKLEGVRYASFIEHAFNVETGRFRNFMTYDQRWTEDVGSEDSHGRALTALGTALELGEPDWLVGCATELFHEALRVVPGFSSPRGLALSSFGLAAYLQRCPGDRYARSLYRDLAERLLRQFVEHSTPNWLWPEDILTYDNGCLPQALLQAGDLLSRSDMTTAGLSMLTWLMRIQSAPDGHFMAVGNRGWYRRDGTRARFDQQPIEAQSSLTACLEAWRVTGDTLWRRRAQTCLAWFLGDNDLGEPLADVRSGACRDGLHGEGANQNQGAESTLAWMLSLVAMQRTLPVRLPDFPGVATAASRS